MINIATMNRTKLRGIVARHTQTLRGGSTVRTTTDDEAKRTSPLALWRYAHDYLRAAQSLCRQHRIACRESQAAYHVASEGLTFTVKAYLRSKGATMAELDHVIGRSLTEALIRGEAQGLPPIPTRWRAAVAEVAECSQDTEFIHLQPTRSSFVDVGPLVDYGVWILDRIAPDVADHYVRHLADGASPSTQEFVGRLRADLRATSDIAAA